MYSCDQDHTATRTAATTPYSIKYQPCNTATARTLHNAGDQVPEDARAPPRRPRRRHSTARGASASHRSSTTVVATDVTNFRAMVQELTGFPPAAIFRPMPRRVHAAGPLGGVRGCGGTSGGGGGGRGGGALRGNGSDAATAAGHSSPDVPAAQPLTHPPQCAPPGVFDGLADLGSPEFGAWADLSFE